MSAAPPFPTLETPRLLLREITMDDVPAIFAIHGDPEVMKWFGTDPAPDVAAAEAIVKLFQSWRVAANPGVRWGLQVKATGELIGSAGLFGWHRSWKKCVTGYELARHAQGHGYMGEALSTLLDWGFEHMGLNRVEAQVHPENAASLQSVRRLGFVEEGRLREVGYWGGRHHDLLQFALLRRDWEARGA